MRIENSELRAEQFAYLAVAVAQGHIARKYAECTCANRSDFQAKLVAQWLDIDGKKNIHA